MKDYYLTQPELRSAAAYYALHFPQEAHDSVLIADHAVNNEFIVPYTGDLTRWIPLGNPVDWLHNPGNDPEFTWGMNRHWHMLDLGKAYLMNGRPQYVTAFTAHFRSWRAQNPVPVIESYEEAVFFQKLGPWRLLETGLRVQSWISAYKYMEDSPLLDEEFRSEFLAGLEEHAGFLTCYLGSTEINHAIMHMQGLYMIAAFYHWHPRAPYWRQLAEERLELCLLHQVGPEGVQIELTTHYHDAAIEMFGTPYLLGALSGHPFSAWYGGQLRKMAAFTEALVRPDQQSTGIGDSDWTGDGRRRLTLLGAILADDALTGRGTGNPECLWLLGAEEYERCIRLQAAHTPSVSSVAFPQTGYYIMRDRQQYLFFDAAPMGGAHGHADALNLEWMWKQQLLFTDTGRYTYEEGEWRRYFKSTLAHNTITVDGEDQTPYVSSQQWGEPLAGARTLRYESGSRYHFIDAAHDGYTRLPGPVVHRRWVLSGKDIPLMLIADWLEGDAAHSLEQRFHLHPEAVPRLSAEDGRTTASVTYPGSGVKLNMIWTTSGLTDERFSVTKQEGWVSEIYGSKSEIPVLAGKADFAGRAGILTVCLPGDTAEDSGPLRVIGCIIDAGRQTAELTYMYGAAAGTIMIGNDTLEWTE
ncbi:alginate lyase family protein [Paenibacillus sp. MMS20-IR301]|uniref:alginate lyase family protein n=1 Tax=Paenibacillus sp. MMS20-IR301 TaxID=2895946 RepID=UPI0028F14BB8|nr:alginate lyase family protein [Paenibacillus sp. MMS20-IR301]WNS43760.1 alginate lyase family protein [Paenibacillus sp. MMS20-IR301]